MTDATLVVAGLTIALLCAMYSGNLLVLPEEVGRYAVKELLFGMSCTTIAILQCMAGVVALTDGKPYLTLASIVLAGYVYLLIYPQANEIASAFRRWNAYLHQTKQT